MWGTVVHNNKLEGLAGCVRCESYIHSHAQVTLIKNNLTATHHPRPRWLFISPDCVQLKVIFHLGPVISNAKCRWLMNSQPKFIKESSKQLHVKQHLLSRGSDVTSQPPHSSADRFTAACFLSLWGTRTGRRLGLGQPGLFS